MYQVVSKYRNGNVFKISSGFPKQFKNNYVAIHRHMFSNSLYGKSMNVFSVLQDFYIKQYHLKNKQYNIKLIISNSQLLHLVQLR